MTRHPVLRRGRQLAVASAGALAVGALAFASAGSAAAQASAPARPAVAESGSFVYLATSTSNHLVAPSLKVNGTVGVEHTASGNDNWNVIDKGFWSAAGVSGESWEFQVSGTNLCVSDTNSRGTTGQGGASGDNVPVLATCNANGTVWVASPNGDGYFLYDRYLLDNGGFTDIMGDYNPGSNNVYALVDNNDLNSNWFVRWLF